MTVGVVLLWVTFPMLFINVARGITEVKDLTSYVIKRTCPTLRVEEACVSAGK